MEITRSGSQPSGKGPTDYFTGAVRVDPLVKAALAAGNAVIATGITKETRR